MSSLDTARLVVRDMQSSDLTQVVAIERNAQPSPWGRLSFEESLAREHVCRVLAYPSAEHASLRATANVTESQTILAYHVICPVADELHILNLVVAQQYQGQGLSHMLMEDIVATAYDDPQTRKIFLEVRSSNEVAQNLYQQWQFNQIAIRKKYYQALNQEREDALVMIRQINS